MEDKEKFTWVPFFNELFHVVCEKYNKNTLVDLLYKVFDDKKVLQENKIFEFDPLSFIAEFNINKNNSDRIEYCNKVKEILNLKSETPTDFRGIPTFNNQNAWFFGNKRENIDDIGTLWNFSVEIHKTVEIREDLFNLVLNIPNVGVTKISQFIFIIFPQKYYPMDKKTLSLFPNFAKKETFDCFKEFQKEVKENEKFKNMKPYELSDYAYQQNKQINDTTQKQYWIYAPGEHAEKWDEYYNKKIMGIGWGFVGDIKNINNRKEIDKILNDNIKDSKSESHNNISKCLWDFANEMKVGDIVFVKKGVVSIIGRGIVTGNYKYDDTIGDGFKHIREIKWTHKQEYECKKEDKLLNKKTLTNITKYRESIEKLENIFKIENQDSNDNYWFLNANPDYWKVEDQKIGEEHSYTLYNEFGNKRRIFQNFLDAKPEDNIIIYESRPTQKIVALGKITKRDDERLYFKKTEDLINPIEYSTIKNSKELENMEYLKNPQGSLFKLTEDEYNFIKKLSKGPEVGTIMQPLNQILYGPPGTGKTYNTIIKAMEIIDSTKYDDVDNETYKELKNRFDELKKSGQIEFITFHQSYSYEEFIEGIKPHLNNSNLSYYKSEGIFKKICRNASKNLYKQKNDEKTQAVPFEDVLEYFKEKYPEGSNFENLLNISYEGNNLIYHFGKQDQDRKIDLSKIEKIFSLNKKYKTAIAFNKEYNGNSALKGYYHNFYKELLNIKNTLEDENQISIENNKEYIVNEKAPRYVLIIDEINRGNISKIFGELITLIEPDKRKGAPYELKVSLTYSPNDELFSVPKNLYIIGTMNTSDRSIASVDIALRRRFKFIEMMPQSKLVTDISIKDENKSSSFKSIFEALNEKITILLDRDHQIGHSYFLKGKINSIDDLKNVWFDEILPLLNEYFYNDWDKLQALLGKASKNNDSFITIKETELPFYQYDIEDKVYDFVDKGKISDNFELALLKIIDEPKNKQEESSTNEQQN